MKIYEVLKSLKHPAWIMHKNKRILKSKSSPNFSILQLIALEIIHFKV